ncbi:type VII secretion effector, SACOL2603 family [Evansella caseinilytica]|uniref:Type VII secretion effector, SACOL2603 family n=1 Tax=Evansella caseinilytica TaxID=1503961 RepID=A0A1H3V2N1_9BACI|nr:TIGR04197 family type VII secretion effector [Evansella caseinilytica]SDZ68848.1 type VII secretion effector, SACOL2603 family [Evansella caseinilytica]
MGQQILSNYTTANAMATKMGQAADRIDRCTNKSVQLSERTTLLANKKAISSFSATRQLFVVFRQAFQKDIDNIRSVAKEFERLDENIEKGIGLPTSPGWMKK